MELIPIILSKLQGVEESGVGRLRVAVVVEKQGGGGGAPRSVVSFEMLANSSRS